MQLASKVDEQGFLNEACDSDAKERKNSCQESSRFQFEPIEGDNRDSQMGQGHSAGHQVSKSGDNSPVKPRRNDNEVLHQEEEAQPAS